MSSHNHLGGTGRRVVHPQSLRTSRGPLPDPKVPAVWNAYRDHAAATKLLKQLAEAHPDRCKLA